MMKRLLRILVLFGLSALAVSCNLQEMDSHGQSDDQASIIRFSASYPLVQTRASDAGFMDGDMMGVYVVDYVDNQPGTLATQGNRADNVRFTFDQGSASWNGTTDIYWKDSNTPVDIYGYYPFDAELSNVTDYKFSVSTYQDDAPESGQVGSYEASDLLWAKAVEVYPTDATVTLTYGHMLSCVRVKLQMGDGFEASQWNELNKVVMINNTITDASVDLSTGIALPEDGASVKSIVPYLYNDEYRAIVIPQMVPAAQELINITVDGQSYSFKREQGMTFSSGKMYQFTIRVDKRTDSGDYLFSFVGENINDWEDNSEFVEGSSRAYLTITLDRPGTLEQTLVDSGKDYEVIKSLKVVGEVNHTDLRFMGQRMSSLAYVNLHDIKIIGNENEEDVLIGFDAHSALRGIVFPKYFKKIGSRAFRRSGLFGTVVIPEGVVEIDGEAFSECSGITSVKFPSTLKIIRGAAFALTGIRGYIQLPEGLEIVGPNEYGNQKWGAFAWLDDFSGIYHLPSTLTYYEGLAFPGMTGDIIVPQGVTRITPGAHENSSCTSVHIPEGVERIDGYAFRGSKIQGELKLPSTCKYIAGDAFKNTNISSVILPDNLRFLGAGAFADCKRLTGVLEFPERLIRVSESLFEDCTMLEGVILHEDVVSIEDYAFSGCHNMSSFICMAEEPPYLAENAFNGVPRDNFTVEVPSGSIDKYKRAPGWREFKRIAEYSNFVCRPSAATALNTMRRQTLVLNADGPWTVTSMPEWCIVSPMSGDGKTQLALTINEMPHGSPERSDDIVFTLTETGHQTSCEVHQYDYIHQEDQVLTLQTASKGRGIDIIFVGDGWDASSISNGSYLTLINEQMEHFFGIEPYATYRDYFNVYTAIALSQEVGVNTLNTYRDTRFMTLYGGGGCNNIEPHLTVDKDLVFDYVVQHSPIEKSQMPKSLVILVPNSTDYGGCTYIYDDGSAISICCPSEEQYPSDTRGIIQHEAGGHGFGKLGDEMVLRNMFVDNGTVQQIRYYHARNWYKNVATSGKMSEVPWAHFIFDPEYSDYVDMFEGGMGFTRGVWRSEQNSCMNYGVPYYNAISRQEIMRKILDYSGEGFTMEKFYATDSKAWGPTGTKASAMSMQPYVENEWHSGPYVE